MEVARQTQAMPETSGAITPLKALQKNTISEFSSSELKSSSNTEFAVSIEQSTTSLLTPSGEIRERNDDAEVVLSPRSQQNAAFQFDKAKLAQFIDVLSKTYPSQIASRDEFGTEVFVIERDESETINFRGSSEKCSDTPYVIQILKLVAGLLNSSSLAAIHRKYRDENLLDLSLKIVAALAQVEEKLKMEVSSLYGESQFNVDIEVNEDQFASLGLHWFGWIINECTVAQFIKPDLDFHQRVCVLALQRLVKLVCFGQAISLIDNVCSLVLKKVRIEGETSLDHNASLREFMKENKKFCGLGPYKKKKASASWAVVLEEMQVHSLFTSKQPACLILEQFIMEVEARDSAFLEGLEEDLKRIYAFDVIAKDKSLITKFSKSIDEDNIDLALQQLEAEKKEEEAARFQDTISSLLDPEACIIGELDSYHLGSSAGRSIKRLLGLLAFAHAKEDMKEPTRGLLMEYADFDKDLELEKPEAIITQIKQRLLLPNQFRDQEKAQGFHILTLPPSQQLVLYLVDFHLTLLLKNRSCNRALGRKMVSDIAASLIPNDFKRRVLLDHMDSKLGEKQEKRFLQSRDSLNRQGYKVFSDFCPKKAFLQDATPLSSKLELLAKEPASLGRTLYKINELNSNYSFGEVQRHQDGPHQLIAGRVLKIISSLQQQGRIPDISLEKLSPSSSDLQSHVYILIPGYKSEQTDLEEYFDPVTTYLNAGRGRGEVAAFALKWSSGSQQNGSKFKKAKDIIDYDGPLWLAKVAFEGVRASMSGDEMKFEAARASAKVAGQLLACSLAIRHPFKFQTISFLSIDMGSIIVTSCLETLSEIFGDLLSQQQEILDQILNIAMIGGQVPTDDLERWAQIQSQTVLASWKRVFFKRTFPFSKSDPSYLALNIPGVENLNLTNAKEGKRSLNEPENLQYLLQHIKFE